MVTPCAAQKHDGTACRARAARGSAYCLSHDPARAAQLAEARRKGGQGKAAKRRAMKELEERALSAAAFGGLIGAAALEVYAGKKSPAVANAIANLGKAALAIKEATEVEERLAALEAAAGLGERRRA
jgi:hypothetical protein